MKKSLYDELCCPNCMGSLDCTILAESSEGRDGFFECNSCMSLYPMTDGIPVLLKDDIRNLDMECAFWDRLENCDIKECDRKKIAAEKRRLNGNGFSGSWEWEELDFWDKEYESQWEKLISGDPGFDDALFRERILQRTREMSIMTQPGFFPEGIFLEAGAGTAIYTRPILANYSGNGYIAVDMSFYALKIRRRLLDRPDSLFVMASVDNLPLKKGGISGMFLIGILHHAERKEQTLPDLVQHLCPQGCIYLDEVLRRPSFLKHGEVVKGVDVSLHEDWIQYEPLIKILEGAGDIVYKVAFNTPFYQFALRHAKGFVIRNYFTYSIIRAVDKLFRKLLGGIISSFTAGEISVVWRRNQ